MEKVNVKMDVNVGFTGYLQLLFIALKLTGHIGWAWAWVLSPSLLCVGLGIVAFVACYTPLRRAVMFAAWCVWIGALFVFVLQSLIRLNLI